MSKKTATKSPSPVAAKRVKPKAVVPSRAPLPPIAEVPFQEKPGDALAKFNYLGLVVDVFFDDDQRIHLTQVFHGKREQGRAWTGWDAQHLLTFIQEQIEQHEAAPSSVSPAALADLQVNRVSNAPNAPNAMPSAAPALPIVLAAAKDATSTPTGLPQGFTRHTRLKDRIAGLMSATGQVTEASPLPVASPIAAPVAAPVATAIPPMPGRGLSRRLQRRLAASAPAVSALLNASAASATEAVPDQHANSQESVLIVRSSDSFDAPLPQAIDKFAGATDAISYRYVAAVYAKRCDGSDRLLLGQREGTLANLQDQINVKVSGAQLRSGLYRLHSSLTVTAQPVGAQAAMATTQTAFKSSLLQVI